MNCQGFEKIVIALAHNQLLDAALCSQSLMHTAACVRCSVRLTEERTLTVGVRAAAAEIALQEAPAHLEAALLKAFRQHTTALTSSTVVAKRRRKPHASAWKHTAIAAGVLLLISALASFWLPPSWSNWQRQEVATSAAPAAAESLVPAVITKAPDSRHKIAPSPASRGSQKRQRHQTYKQSVSEAEVVTEFFPLLEGDDLDSLESGQIVRVELSGAALLEVGLPLDAAMTSEIIKADVVLGHDGQARAIRFVR